MSRKQRQLLLMLAAFALVIGVKSSAAGESGGGAGNSQKQQTERWKILQDQQINQETVAPKGGSTGPTVPPKPTQGNVHR